MKRIISYILVSVMLMVCFLPTVYADTLAEAPLVDRTGEGYEELRENSVTFTCTFGEEAKSIEIKGNVNHDVLVSHKKYTIEVYRIAPGATFADIVSSESSQSVASAAIAVKFEFSVSAKTAQDKFSQYAIALRSPEDELILAAAPRYVKVESSYVYDGSSNTAYKGVSSPATSVCGDLGFGTAIIPVYYDKLLSTSSNGYMYPVGDSYCYFDKSYVDELGGKIRTYSATGGRVYLQLLLPSGSSVIKGYGGEGYGAIYDMPDIYSPETLSMVSTFVEFLAERYDSYMSGVIGGFIVGSRIDSPIHNFCTGLDVTEYAQRYAYYLTVVASVARYVNPNMDIVIPFSNADAYSSLEEGESGSRYSAQLLEGVLSALDGSTSSAFSCSTMIEVEGSPIEDSQEEKSKKVPVEYEGSIGINNVDVYSAFLSDMRARYKSAPSNFIYVWKVPDTLVGNDLCCAYAYSYYSLLDRDGLSSFVVSFEDSASNGVPALNDVKKLVRYIDTDSGPAESGKLLQYFGASSWTEVVNGLTTTNRPIRKIYSTNKEDLSSIEWTGSFSYFDFSSGNISDWAQASNGKILKSEHGKDGRRALRQNVSKVSGSEHSDLFCLYEYTENFVYTPALKFELEITDVHEDSTALYEVAITVGCGGSLVNEKYVVRAGEVSELWLDMRAYNAYEVAKYIKISTRSITGTSEEYSLWLYDVVGYSAEYDSEALDKNISAERLRVRDLLDVVEDDESEADWYWIVFGLLVVAAVVVGVVTVLLRRDDTGRDRKGRKR